MTETRSLRRTPWQPILAMGIGGWMTILLGRVALAALGRQQWIPTTVLMALCAATGLGTILVLRRVQAARLVLGAVFIGTSAASGLIFIGYADATWFIISGGALPLAGSVLVLWPATDRWLRQEAP